MISTFSVSATMCGLICSRTKNSSSVRRVFDPCLEDDERLADQRLDADRVLGRQRMPDRHDQHQLLAQHRHARERGIVDRQREQREVGAPRAQPAQQPLRAAGGDLDVHVRMVLLELLQQQREHVEADGHPADEVERARERLLLVGDAGRGVADVVEDAVTELEDRLAGRGDLDAAPEPDEQPLVEFVLEQEDLAADGGLRNVQPAPAPVNEPVSAMARTISSCLRSIFHFARRNDAIRIPRARSKIESIYPSYAGRLWISGR